MSRQKNRISQLVPPTPAPRIVGDDLARLRALQAEGEILAARLDASRARFDLARTEIEVFSSRLAANDAAKLEVVNRYQIDPSAHTVRLADGLVHAVKKDGPAQGMPTAPAAPKSNGAVGG